MYVAQPASNGEPPRQLVGFQKVTLAPGQTRHLTFTLGQRAFSTWDSASQQWGTADGNYGVYVGDSSRSLPLHGTVSIHQTFGTQSIGVSAPHVAASGSTVPVTTTFTNTGDFPIGNVQVSLDAPSGWTAQATSPSSLDTVAPRSSVHTTWQVTVPASATPGRFALDAVATYHNSAGSATAKGTAEVNVPYASLAAAFDNTGITDDANPAAGAFASSGKTYSAQALAAAGVAAGPVSYAGTSFTWPAVGQPDNVEADGQVVGITGSGSELAFLGASTNGTQGGAGTVYYADGSSEPFTLSFSDWWVPDADDQVVATAAYINQPTGRFDHTGSVYFASVPLQAGKPVEAVALPTTGASPSPGMHVFAMAVR